MKGLTAVLVLAITTSLHSGLWGASHEARTAVLQEPSDQAISELKAQIEELARKLEELEKRAAEERRAEEQKQAGNTAGQERGPARPVVRADAGGFSVHSPEGDFSLRLRSLIQADGRFFVEDSGSSNPDTFLIRRARIEMAGTLFKSFDFRVMPDLAGSSTTLLDAWLRWRVIPSVQIQMGKVKLPIGLERAQARESNLFTEFGYTTVLAPNRDIGVNVQGQAAGGSVDYFLGVFNGTADGGSSVTDSSDGKSVAARVFILPFGRAESSPLRGLGVGLAGSYAREDGGIPSGYRSVGQASFFRWRSEVVTDGTIWRVVPQFYYFNGPLGLLGEYAISSHEVRSGVVEGELRNSAWQVVASCVLTGENATFRGVKPRRSVGSGSGNLGAWQFAARLTELQVADAAFPIFADPSTSASHARTWSGGVNWYLNPVIRWSADYDRTAFRGSHLRDEGVLITRLQVRF